MKSVKHTVVLLLFLNFVLNILAKEYNIRTDKRKFFQGPRNSLINFLAKKKGYDTNGWIDISLLDGNFNSIDIKVHNDKVICNEGNKILEVSVEKQTLIQQTGSATYNEVLFSHIQLAQSSRFVNPLPVMKSNNYSNAVDPKIVLPANFEGYVVCEKKDSNALLIPKNFETVEFIAPPWSVRVSIDVFRNPISQYGRQFRVTIIDNVNILMNNQSSFIWPIPFESFSEVYDFHLAVRDSKEGRFCILERDLETFELNLSCSSWKRTYKLSLVNTYFLAGFLGMNTIQGISYPFLKSKKISYYEEPRGGDVFKILLDDESKNPDGTNVYVDNGYEQNRKARRWIGALSNIIYLGTVALTNAIYGTIKFINIRRNLDRFNREFEEAPLYYPWKLQYPEDYYTPNNVEVNETQKSESASVTDSEEKVDDSPVPEEIPEKEQTEDENLQNPTILKQVEQIIVDNDS
ncbi:conserved Plasmodium protein, unknown function [Plasmodium gallinaceum]|uniref:Parasitophorous vacuolar protein 2 n=1 Tax=Plasmodium gallinaceum TaxID=5849 RepID=A0A1J1GMT3_PLAGA|nr:conserved Plasmodium protein, unknown function [Plasmodium gallinaceum]CRG93573.1 conserved Plasmodium protein, unknown function [Plasmodium gallinaceum]